MSGYSEFYFACTGFPFILLGILRMKRKKKKAKEGGLVSSLHPFNSLPQVVVAFAKKSPARKSQIQSCDMIQRFCMPVHMSKYTVIELKSEFHKLVSPPNYVEKCEGYIWIFLQLMNPQREFERRGRVQAFPSVGYWRK